MSNENGLPRWYDQWQQYYDEAQVIFQCKTCGEVYDVTTMECTECRGTEFECLNPNDPENKEYTLEDENE